MKDNKNIKVTTGQLIALVVICTLFLTYSSAPFFIGPAHPFYKYLTGPFRIATVIFLIGCAIVADQLTRVPPRNKKTKESKEK